MSEQFMTRRERREAERRMAQKLDAAGAEPAAGESPTSAGAADHSDAPVETAQQSPVRTEAPAPSAPADAPFVPAATSQPSERVPEMPVFATRAERKRFLREHGLDPNTETTQIPTILAAGEGASGDSQADVPAGDESVFADAEPVDEVAADDRVDVAASDEAPADPVETQAESADQTEAVDDAGSDETASHEPASDTQDAADDATPADAAGAEGEAAGADADDADSGDEAAGDADTESAADDDFDEDSEATAAIAAVDVDDEDDEPVDPSRHDFMSRRLGSGGFDFDTQSTAVVDPAGLGEHDAPLQRRGAVPAGDADAEPTLDGAEPIDSRTGEPASRATFSGDEDEAARSAKASSAVFSVFDGSAPADATAAADADEETARADAEDASSADEEIADPPAQPMSARSVTYQDGDILVGDGGSKAPVILLGAAGLVAVLLIVFALFLLL